MTEQVEAAKNRLFEAIDAWPTTIDGHRIAILEAYDLLNVASKLPALAVEEKLCPSCGHKAHFALRCGAVFSKGPGGDYGEDVLCECLNWSPVEEKAAPSTAKFLELYTEEAPGLWVRKTKPQPDSSSIPERTFEEWWDKCADGLTRHCLHYDLAKHAWNAAKGLK